MFLQLAHPIVDSLHGTDNAWVIELLHAFNNGDIARYEAMRPTWTKIPDLLAQEAKLREKISLLCLMEMTFKRASDQRSISFEDIAQEARIPVADVELLVMKALAKELVRGAIDQVSSVVNLTWVQPRVLSREQVGTMTLQLDRWTSSISQMEHLMEAKANEILTN